jgi:hypothetical protein
MERSVGHRERQKKIRALQEARGGTTVISYLTSTRAGAEGQMGLDAVGPLYSHLRELKTAPDETRIDLFLVSNGGEGIVPWRIVTLVRQFCSEFNVLVPNRAFSAATLLALGADDVLMHPMGMLGPTDPSITGPLNPTNPLNPGQTLPVSVEDVASYIALVKEDVGIRHEDELVKCFLALAEKVHPLTLGGVKRTTAQSRMLAEKLLRRRTETLPPSSIEEVVRKLTSELFFHGHPINAREAREDVGLPFVKDATPDVAEAMWQLYEIYRDDLCLDEPFILLQQAIRRSPLAVPAGPSPGMMATLTQATVKLDPVCFAIVESFGRSDAMETEIEVTMVRDHLGNYQTGQPQTIKQRWVDRTDREEEVGTVAGDDMNAAAELPTTGGLAEPPVSS